MSTKSIAEKLHIKPNVTVWSSDDARTYLLEPLPDGVHAIDSPGQAAVAVVFADDEASLRKVLMAHRAALARSGAFWVAYPKANRTDINRDSLWPILGEYGMRPISQVALDPVWSALRFRALADGESPFTGGR